MSIEEHIAEKTDELVTGGMSREDAERAARRAFGNRAAITERSREAWQWPTLEGLWADMRFALRQLIKSPGFTATAISTLAMGIAVNATMFSMVSAFIMPKLPGRDAASMVAVSSVDPDGGFLPDANPVSAVNYLAWRHDPIFAEMAAEADRYGSLAGPEGLPEEVRFETVTPNFFTGFGVDPELGRGFAADEDQPGHNHVVILSHGLWARRYGADRGIVGRTIRLNREDYTVIGVMGADFRLMGLPAQLWTPLALTAADQTEAARRDRHLFLFARMAPGVTLAQARAEMNLLAARAQHDFPAEEQRWGAMVRMLPDFLIHNFAIRNAMLVMMTTVLFILLIACANVAGLLLTRAAGRQKELAIRASLGATRLRMMRQLLTEGLVIAVMGGAGGLALAAVGIRLLAASLTFNDAVSAIPLRLDGRVLLFTLCVTVACAVLSSLAPALKASRASLQAGLQGEGRTASAGRERSRLRAVLVGGEIAAALFLLIGTTLLIRGIYNMEHMALGFRQDHVLTAGIGLDHARYGDAAKQIEFVRSLTARLEQIPGVQDVAVTSDLPATGGGSVNFRIKGEPPARANERRTALHVVAAPDYFQVSGIPVLRGRVFTAADDARAPAVVVVNHDFVHRYLGDGEALGSQIEVETSDGTRGWTSIVGVVSDVKTFSQDSHVDPEIYEAFAQRSTPSFSVMMRTGVDPDSLLPELRRTVEEADPELPLLQAMSMKQVIEAQRNGDPLFERILGGFAVLALILAAIGIYGLVAYTVSQRTQEIGIRLALGAKQQDIRWMILREGLIIAAVGTAVGVLLALPLPRAFSAMFFGMPFGGPVVYPLVAAAVALVTLAAIYGPARRAMRVEPMAALRVE